VTGRDGNLLDELDEQAGLDDLVRRSLAEDLGDGDRTTCWTVPRGARSRAIVVARHPLVVAGLEPLVRVFRQADPELDVTPAVQEGDHVEAGRTVLEVQGPTAPLLTAERTALNFLGRLSGIATLTSAFVEAVEGTGARITDTRKTTPGLRPLEKAAVRAGGGANHRMGLHDMVLVKENHVAAAGGIRAALEAVHRQNLEGLPVEVEVRSLEELELLRGLPVDRALLDNLSTPLLQEAVRRVQAWPSPRPELEASGNMTLERVREVAETGVQWISVGALTHSAPVADFSLLVEEAGPPPVGALT
jgi:nicotinate-nucleotide pyrophosphorylase (carboxylating)